MTTCFVVEIGKHVHCNLATWIFCIKSCWLLRYAICSWMCSQHVEIYVFSRRVLQHKFFWFGPEQHKFFFCNYKMSDRLPKLCNIYFFGKQHIFFDINTQKIYQKKYMLLTQKIYVAFSKNICGLTKKSKKHSWSIGISSVQLATMNRDVWIGR